MKTETCTTVIVSLDTVGENFGAVRASLVDAMRGAHVMDVTHDGYGLVTATAIYDGRGCAARARRATCRADAVLTAYAVGTPSIRVVHQ